MPTIFSTEHRRQQEGVMRQRKELLRQLFTDFSQLIVNTGKQAKAEALLALIGNISGQNLNPNQVNIMQGLQVEPTAPQAATVAKSKVVALEGVLSPEEIGEPAILKAGSDVNAFIFDGVAWTQEHKLARHHERLNLEQFLILRQQLLVQYCFPKNGQVRLRWDMATHLVNGRAHTFNDVVEVISQPLDPALLDQFLIEAWLNGLMLSSNLHFATFEALLKNDKIISIAHLPMELAEQGRQLADFVTTEISPTLTGAILHSIISNSPVYIK